MSLPILDTVKTGDIVYRVLPKPGYGPDPDTWEIKESRVIKAGPQTFRLTTHLGPYKVIYYQIEIGRHVFKTKREAVDRFLDERRKARESMLRQADEALHAFRWVSDHLLPNLESEPA